MQLAEKITMQESPFASIRGALALAALAVLSGNQAPAQAPDSATPWEVDSRLLYYNETDRVKVVKGTVRTSYTPSDEKSFGLTVTVDTMTGASPNGAIPVGEAQTFTRPSGKGTYTTPAQQQPLDDTFKDTRVGLAFDAMHALSSQTRIRYAIQGSKEYDYMSFGASLGVERDFNLHNTTLGFNLSANMDQSKPVGGMPEPLSYMPSHPLVKQTIGDSDRKKVLDAQLSLTQLLSPRSLIRTNLVFGIDDGYLNDPYKIVSRVDMNGALVSDPEMRYLYEKRPDRKTRWAWHTAYQRQMENEDVLHVSYRLYKDDWGILSHTVDGTYRFEFKGRQFLEPHVRYYRQSAADFYRTSLPSLEVPEFVSADYRLADLQTYTAGLTWGMELSGNREIRFGAEYYQQKADPSSVIGVQKNLTLIEDLKVFMVRVGYAFRW